MNRPEVLDTGSGIRPDIRDERIRRLNTRPVGEGDFVLYWIQQSQRVEFNHAFEYAAHCANELGQPLLVCFALTSDFPEANLRHYRFMLEGLRETSRAIMARGAGFVLRTGEPSDVVIETAKKASLCIVDRGYLRVQRAWREAVARKLPVAVLEVETDVVIPVETVSHKEEYAAATIRRKIHRQLPAFVRGLDPTELRHRVVPGNSPGTFMVDPNTPSPRTLSVGATGVTRIDDLSAIESRLDLDCDVAPVDWIHGGRSEAMGRLDSFIDGKLPDYADLRNDPSLDYQSDLSPYLHFGQISVLEIVQAVLGDEEAQDRSPMVAGEWIHGRLSAGAQAFLEELIIRRELSMNFVHFCESYDTLDSLPDWARTTIRDHAKDERPYLYDLETLERGDTHDIYWNAAQTEMVRRGKMHGYMRMYWGKKIIEWSPSAEVAHRAMCHLNNRYFLDGRDANGYTGIAWCFGKHDRPWQERPIFGKLRYMNARGLERKFDINEYVRLSGQWPDPAETDTTR